MPDSPRQWTRLDALRFVDDLQKGKTELESRLREVEAELARANAALEECTRLSGADLSDGFPTWPSLPDLAVQEVKQLRADYDECPTPEDLQEATAALQWIETRLSRHREPRVEAIDKALERARGVLRKGDTGGG